MTSSFGKMGAVTLLPFVRRRMRNRSESLFTTKPRRRIMPKTYRMSILYRYNYIYLTVQLRLHKILCSGHIRLPTEGDLTFISKLWYRARIIFWFNAATYRTRRGVYNFFVVIRTVCKCTTSITIISSRASTLTSTFVYNIWPVVFTATTPNTQLYAVFED